MAYFYCLFLSFWDWFPVPLYCQGYMLVFVSSRVFEYCRWKLIDSSRNGFLPRQRAKVRYCFASKVWNSGAVVEGTLCLCQNKLQWQLLPFLKNGRILPIVERHWLEKQVEKFGNQSGRLTWKGGENWKMGSDFLFLSSSSSWFIEFKTRSRLLRISSLLLTFVTHE